MGYFTNSSIFFHLEQLGSFDSLKHVKKDIMEMRKGGECGIGFGDEWTGFQVGDLIQCYEEKFEKRHL